MYRVAQKLVTTCNLGRPGDLYHLVSSYYRNNTLEVQTFSGITRGAYKNDSLL